MTATSPDVIKPDSIWSNITKATGKLSLVAWPVALSQFLQIANAIADSVMAGHLGAEALAAIAIGTTLWVPVITVLSGFLYILSPIAGKLVGGQQEDQVGPVLARGLLLGLGLGLIAGLGLWFGAQPFFAAIGIDPALSSVAADYVQWLAWGFPAFGLFLAMRFTIEGFGLPKLVTAIGFLCVLANIALNYGFMYGGFGFPNLGAAGCGTATGIVLVLHSVLVFGVCLGNARLKKALASLRDGPFPSFGEVFGFARSGLPVALNLLSDYAVVSVIGLAIALISTEAVGGHQIAYNLLTALLVLPIGFGMASSILMAQSVGAQDLRAMKTYLWTTLGICLLISVVASAILAAVPDLFARLYTNDPAVIAQAQDLFIIIVLILAIDALVIVMGFQLRGLGDMTGPFVITVVAHWGISLPAGYLIASETSLGATGWWAGLGIGLTVAFAASVFRLRSIFKNRSLTLTNG